MDDIFRIVQRRFASFVVVAIAVFAAAVGIIALRTPVYTAQAVLIVSSSARSDSNPSAGGRAASAADELEIQTIEQVLHSRKVAAKLKDVLSDTINVQDLNTQTPLERIKSALRGNADAAPSAAAPPAIDDEGDVADQAERAVANERAVVLALLDAIQVSRVGGSRLIRVYARTASPQVSALVANAVPLAYRAYREEELTRDNERRIERLEQAVEGARADLYEAELSIARYMRENNLLSQQTSSTIEGRMSRLEAELANVRAETATRRLTQLRAREQELEETLATATVVYGAGYPEVIATQERLATIRAEIDKEQRRVSARLSRQSSSLDATAAALSSEISAIRQKHFDDIQANAGLRELEVEAASRLQIFERLKKRLNEAQEFKAADGNALGVISSADTPSNPSSASPASLAAIGGFAAVFLGFVGALAAEGFDRRVRNGGHVRRWMGVDAVAMVPTVKGLHRRPDAVQRQIEEQPSSTFAIAARNLFLELNTPNAEPGPRLIVVTSIAESAGRSTVAKMIAATASKFGASQLHFTLNERNELIQETNLDEEPTVAEQLEQARASGQAHGLSANVAPAAESETRNLVLQELAYRLRVVGQHIDIVVVETPSILRTRDAKALAPFASNVVVVLEWGKTKLGALRAARTVLSGCANVCAVINRVNWSGHAKRGYGDEIEFAPRV